MKKPTQIVAVTQPLINDELYNTMSIDDFIAYCARVSNPSNQMNNLTAPKLLRYCAEHKHWSIFEMVNLVIEVNTTRDIGRQILRHRSFSFQEFSQRYADPTQLGFQTKEARLQDTKNRQNSTEIDHYDDAQQKLFYDWEQRQKSVIENVTENYKWAIDNGIAKEQARAVLPEGLTMSRLYINGTLRSWIHYCQLRTGNGTQKEHRDIAISAWDQIIEIFPSLKGMIEIEEHAE